MLVYFFALTIRTAWRRVARVRRLFYHRYNNMSINKSLPFYKKNLTWYRRQGAVLEGISSIPGSAGARGKVVDHLTVSVLPASSRTRVLALIVDAGQVRHAIRIQDTFRPTALVGIPHVVRETRARSGPVSFLANSVGSARTRVARIQGNLRQSNRLKVAENERISDVTLQADAVRRVAHHATVSVLAASSRTRVPALLVDTGQIALALAVADTFRFAIGGHSDKFQQARTGGRLAYNSALGVWTAR